jgi:hypothetical protein
MKFLLFSLVLFTLIVSRIEAVGESSYWTLDVRPETLSADSVPFLIRLEIGGADSVLLHDLPPNWAVTSSNDRSGIFYVELMYCARDDYASLRRVSLTRLLSSLEVRAGDLFAAPDKDGEYGQPDRGKKVTVKTAVYYYPEAFDFAKDRRRRTQSKVLELKDDDLIHALHDQTPIAGG